MLKRIFFILSCITVFIFILLADFSSLTVNIEMTNILKNDSIDIFYAKNSKFSEKPETITYFVLDRDQNFLFKLPQKTHSIQVFPGHFDIDYSIKSIEIDTGFFTFALLKGEEINQLFKASDQIVGLSVKQGILTFKSSGYEPVLASNQAFSNLIQDLRQKSNLKYTCFFIFLLLIAVTLFLFRKSLIIKIKNLLGSKIGIGVKIFLWILLGFLVAFIFSRSNLTWQSLQFSFQLFFAFLFISLAGILLSGILNGFWFKFQSNFYLFHAFIIGQLFLIAYLFLRSFLNAAIGFVIPITWIDFILILTALFLINYKSGHLKGFYQNIRTESSRWILFLVLTWALFLIIAINELPNLIPYETDHQVHFFLTKQIERFQTIPFNTQFEWGNLSFGYPTGFHAMSYLWSSLSFIGVQNSVVVQPLIQTQLGLLVVLEVFLISSFAKSRKLILLDLAAFILFFLFYYLFVPYGYFPYYKTSHTGIISSIAVLIPFFSLLMFEMIYWKEPLYRKNFNFILNHIVIILSLALLTLINPILPVHLFFFYIILMSVILIRNKKWSYVSNLLWTLPFFSLIFCDYFYFQKLSMNIYLFIVILFCWIILWILKIRFKDHKAIFYGMNAIAITALLLMILYLFFHSQDTQVFSGRFSSILTSLWNAVSDNIILFKDTLIKVSYFGLPDDWQAMNYGKIITIPSVLIGFLAFMFVFLISFIFKKLSRIEYLFLIFMPFTLLLIFLIINPIAQTLVEHRAISFYSLLEKYFYYSQGQINFVCLYIYLLFFIFLAFRFFKDKAKHAAVALLALSLVFLISAGNLSYFNIKLFFSDKEVLNHNLNGWYYPRKHFVSLKNGAAAESDFAVINQIEKLYENYRQNHKPLEFHSIPKILLFSQIVSFPHQPFKDVIETYLNSYGASCILPIFNVFPPAFFRISGDPDFNFQNYSQKVCAKIDWDWLKNKNIKYAFIPAFIEEDSSCSNSIDEIKKSKKILFQKGKSYFIELF